MKYVDVRDRVTNELENAEKKEGEGKRKRKRKRLLEFTLPIGKKQKYLNRLRQDRASKL